MEPIQPASSQASGVVEKKSQSPADLGSGDFFQLLITQILNQDPFQPTTNEDLLKQISSIRDIELSSTLTDSLQRLSGQQNSSAASSMIGQYATSIPAQDGAISSGLVVAVRFANGGQPVLQLSSGAELTLDQVARIEPAQQAAEALIGQRVAGIDQRVKNSPQLVEGVVSGVRNDSGEILIELDTGGDLRLRDLIGVEQAEAVAA